MLTCILSLALGVGATTAAFSFVDAVQFKALPIGDEDRLVDVSETSATELCAGCAVGTSYPAFVDWRARATSFESLEGYTENRFVVSGGSPAERIGGALVSSGLFRAIGVQPVLGRRFLMDDDRVAAASAVVIGDALWRRRFAADAGILGRTLKVDGVERTIVGVMPPRFAFPEYAEILAAACARGPRVDPRHSLAQCDWPVADGDVDYRGSDRDVDDWRGACRIVRRTSEMAPRGRSVAGVDDRGDGDGVPGAARQRRVRAADRLRECRQPAARARIRAAQRAGDSSRRRRAVESHRPTRADGESRARHRGRRAWTGPGVLAVRSARRPVGSERALLDSIRHRPASPRIRRRGHARDGPHVRHRPGCSVDRLRGACRPPGWRRRRRRPRASSAHGARGRPARPGARAARRCGPAHQDRHPHADVQRRLRRLARGCRRCAARRPAV